MARSRRRSAALLLVLVIFGLASCNWARSSGKPAVETSPRVRTYGDPNAALEELPSPPPPVEESPGAVVPTFKPRASFKPYTGGPDPVPGDDNPAPRTQRLPDFGEAGPAAARVIGRPMLGAGNFTEIVLEIDYVRGYEPSDLAVNHLVAQLKRASGNKKVTLAGGNEMPGGQGSYSSEDVFFMANKRNHKSVAPVAALWVGYFDGNFSGSTAAGLAWNGTTVAAIFPQVITSAAGPGTAYSRAIERTVLTQEIAHNIGLINIGYKSPRDHEATNSKHHSKNPNSVMYYALITPEGMAGVIARGGEFPSNFDNDDWADLADIAAGRI